MIRLILNILWFLAGGWISALLWALAGCVLAITIVGLPWAGAAFRIAGFVLWPFGKSIVERRDFGDRDAGTGCLGVGLNVIWFVLAGWWLALSHLVIAAAEAVTIIGLPFAFKDLQFARLALAPIGVDVVERP